MAMPTDNGVLQNLVRNIEEVAAAVNTMIWKHRRPARS